MADAHIAEWQSIVVALAALNQSISDSTPCFANINRTHNRIRKQPHECTCNPMHPMGL
jgi:hypothetical protein